MDEIFTLVNTSYAIEMGKDGLAFKNENRYFKKEETEAHLDQTWVMVENSDIMGSVTVNVQDRVGMIGPLAVNPKYQGRGLGSKLLNFAETLTGVSQVDVVSCRTDLLPFYKKRGYVEIQRYPAEDYVPVTHLTRTGLSMVLMQKKNISD